MKGKNGRMIVHELKDLAAIYHDCDDYDVVVWNPDLQTEMSFVFTGSDNTRKQINFNVGYKEKPAGGTVFSAFKTIINKIRVEGIDAKDDRAWESAFMHEILNLRK